MLARRSSGAIGSPPSRRTGSPIQRRRSISMTSIVPRLAAMWVGEWDASIEFRQRAFADCIADDEERRAAGLAIDLVFGHGMRNRFAVALGWAGARRAAARRVRALLGAGTAGRDAGDGGARRHARRDGGGRAVRRSAADRSADSRRGSGCGGVGGQGHGIGAPRPRERRPSSGRRVDDRRGVRTARPVGHRE